MTNRKKGGYADRVLRALHEAIAIQRGEMQPAAVSRRMVTARVASAAAAPVYTAGDVKSIRYELELSQPVFAQALNVSPETVRAWEQGKKQPRGPEAKLLEIAKNHPEWVLTSVEAKP